MNLYILNDTSTNGFHSTSLSFITIAAIVCGILVIVSKNPIVSVLFLIGLFLSISIYLMLLGINFIGLSYLLVYVGAVSILFLFILMLINIRISEISTTTSNSLPLAIFIGILFFSTIYQALPLTVYYGKKEYTTLMPGVTIIKDEISKYLYSLFAIFSSQSDNQSENAISSTPASLPSFTSFSQSLLPSSSYTSYEKDQTLEFVSSQSWDSMLAENSDISTLGTILYTSFPLWILLTSLILLLAMVGAIVITLKN